jgi:tetratricopeptide (TPR) repeat protein
VTPRPRSAAVETAVGIGSADLDTAIECSNALSYLGRREAARALLASWPETAAQQLALGALEERHGQYEAALRCYAAAHDSDPAADLPLRKIITLHRRRGAPAEALAMTDRLAALGGAHLPTAWHLRGQILASMGDRDGAIAAWRAAIDLAPQSEPIRLDLARALGQSGQDAQAEALLLGQPPAYASLLALSDIALARRDHDAARRHAEAAVALNPARPEALARIARIEADRGDDAAAHAATDRIAALGSDHALASLRSRIANFRAAGDESGAVAPLLEMAARQPADAGIAAELGRQYRLTGDAVAAGRAVDAALALDPDNGTALTEAAEQATLAEDREGALAFHRRLLAVAPDQVWNHLRVARLLFDLDRPDEAAAAYEVAARLFGQTAEYQGERIRMLREAGQLYQALDAARTAQAAHPSHFGRWFDRFTLELQLSAFEAARRCLEAAPARSRDEAALLICARARLALRARDTDQAIAEYEAALALHPRNRGALHGLFDIGMRRFDLDRAARSQASLVRLDAPGRHMRGATPNGSQSHRGQMLNDMLLDRRAIGVLAGIMLSDPPSRIASLLPMVKARPGHIPTALALLVTLQEGGFFRAQAGVGAAAAIPRHIGQFWDNPDPPADLRELSGSWRALNPGHRHSLFNDATAEAYLVAHFPAPVAIAYRRCPDATTKADLFRLAFLVQDGGVWADMDDRCLAPLSDLIPAATEAFFWQEPTGHLCNNLIAAIPRHPVLQFALVTAVNAINRGDRDKVWMLTGPGLLSRAFAATMAEAGDAWADWLGRITVRDEFDIYPCVGFHCRTSHKRLGRHWLDTAFADSSAPKERASASF